MNALPQPSRAGAVRNAARRLTVLIVLATAAFGTFGMDAQAHTTKKLPPIPDCFKTGSGYGSCDGIAIPGGSAIVQMTAENRKTSFYLTGPAPLQSTKSVACGDAGCVYNHLNWVIGSGGSAVLGCGVNQTTCDVRVAPGAGWVAVYVRQNNDYATLYAIYNTGKKDQAMITGYVTDKQKNGVMGTAVDAYGQGKSTGKRGFATSGDQGFYAMEVPAGSYKVVPSGGIGGKKPPKFDPESTDVSVGPGGKAKANFTLQGGLDVQLTLSSATALGDGYTTITGLVVTTRYGKAEPNVPISLRPNPSLTDATAATKGPFATICDTNSGGRIWPTGSLSAPVGSSVKVTTDKTGRYRFSLTIGTMPGAFPLVAWALDASGQLITTDVSDVSDEATVTIKAPGAVNTSQFASLINSLSTDKTVSGVLEATTNDAASITQSLSQLSRDNVKLGGLAYSLVNGASGGPAVLVYNDADPPSTASSGQVTASPSTLVISPALYAGAATQGIAAGTGFNVALQKGALTNIPNFTKWSAGTGVGGWNLTKGNTASIASQSFEYNGWPYPAAKPGACN